MSKANTQVALIQDLQPSGVLRLHSIFQTIQGEGPFAGVPATFVRLHGCNLRCPMCDTDYTSYDEETGPSFIVEEVRQMAAPSKLVVITGGEPLRQNIGPLIEALLEARFKVQIETNGTLYVPDVPYEEITVVCSPKDSYLHPDLEKHIDALKYVLHEKSVSEEDGLPLKALANPTEGNTKVARPPKDFKGIVYVQPIDVDNVVKNERHLKATINSCMKFGYTLCLQTHKIINME